MSTTTKQQQAVAVIFTMLSNAAAINTDSKELVKYRIGMSALTDMLIETYQNNCGRLESAITSSPWDVDDPLSYLTLVKSKLEGGRKLFITDTETLVVVEQILSLLEKTIRNLKK